MNPARTLGPAIASRYFKGVWVYLLGPVTGTLLGAWSYNLIRVTDKPVQAIPRRFSFGSRRTRAIDEQSPSMGPLDAFWRDTVVGNNSRAHTWQSFKDSTPHNVLYQAYLPCCFSSLFVPYKLLSMDWSSEIKSQNAVEMILQLYQFHTQQSLNDLIYKGTTVKVN
jgi:hypothetical protein